MVTDPLSSEFPLMLLVYLVEQRVLDLQRWLTCIVSGTLGNLTNLVYRGGILGWWPALCSQGVGQGSKFKPSDMTGGCLALTQTEIKTKLYL